MKPKTLGILIEVISAFALIIAVILTKPYTGVESTKTQKGQGSIETKSVEFASIEPQLTGTIFGPSVALVENTPEPELKANVLLAASRTQSKALSTRVVAETAAKVPSVAPTTTPQPQAVPTEVLALIDKYSAEYGVDRNAMIVIAKCESGFDPAALGSGIYGGLYQFITGTWVSNRNAMGLDPNPDLRFNAEEAVKTAAFKMSRDGFGAWPVCGRKV